MLGELEKARVGGLDFNSIQVDIIKLIRHYINEDYSLYNSKLTYLKVEKEDIEMDVYQRLYNRKENQLSNMERYFLHASTLDSGMKYIVCLIKKVVRISILQFFRSKAYSNLAQVCNYADVNLALSDYDIEEGCNRVLTDTKAEAKIYDNLEYRDLLSKVPDLVCGNCYIVNNGRLEELRSRQLLDLVVSGYSLDDLSKLICQKDGSSFSKQVISKVRLEVVELARDSLKEYKGIKI